MFRSKTVAAACFLSFVAFGACRSGNAVGNAPLATGQAGIEAMASDSFFVYWTMDNGEVRRVSLDGGQVQTISSGQPGPSSIALDKTNVYWSDGTGRILRVAKEGGDAALLAQAVAVSNIAVDDQNVYFTSGSNIMSVPKAAAAQAAPTSLVGNIRNPHALAISGALIWASDGPADAALAPQNGDLAEVGLTGGAATNLVTKISPTSLSVANSHLTWTDIDSGVVRTAGIDGSDVHDLTSIDSTATAEKLDAVVNDDTNVYFTTTTGALRVVPLTGGPSEVLLQGPQAPVRITMDQTAVYVANSQEGAIIVLPKTGVAGPNLGGAGPQ